MVDVLQGLHLQVLHLCSHVIAWLLSPVRPYRRRAQRRHFETFVSFNY